jgi:Ca-activated chloride channel homolog
MRYGFPACLLALLVGATAANAHGLLIPEDKSLPPLAMVNHRVNIHIDDQVALTRIEQTFRNHTDRQLEATYIFPIPKGASVNKFTMWVDGKETAGELLDSKKAGEVYQSIVRRTQDPGLLEYIGNNLMRLRVFPVPPKADQKVTISFTSIAPGEGGVVEYIYPLKTDGKATKTLEDFSIKATIKSQHPIQSVYSPTHAINYTRNSDREVNVVFERNQAFLDKDFQIFYSIGNNEIGITPLMYRPVTSDDGYFLLLISPQLESVKSTIIPRDMVLVLDTSGSMDAVKMEQARKALKYCLNNLNSQDRFGVISFSTNVRKYNDGLVEANTEQLDHAKNWVDKLRAGGGTAIQAALDAALEMRSKDEGRSFTIVFFTDGQPTIGEMKPENILKNVAAKNSANTRIFTFGVGDDVNTAMLDRLAESTRAVSTYVRPAEDIEAKVSGLYGKISHPVLANVKLGWSENLKLYEMYPAELPDLFYGSQLVVLGKYSGQGPAAVKLTGAVGKETREFAYDVAFQSKTDESRDFVEHLWARRKVGFLLDQIRNNGEQKELMDEVLTLAKKYGIATPYTSYLIVPDAPMPVANGRQTGQGGGTHLGYFYGGLNAGGSGFGNGSPGGGHKDMPGVPPALYQNASGPKGTPTEPRTGKAERVEDFAKQIQGKPNDGEKARYEWNGKNLQEAETALERSKSDPKGEDKALDGTVLKAVKDARGQMQSYDQARRWLEARDLKNIQAGNSVAVDLAICSNNLRCQDRLTQTANRVVQGRNCLEIGGVWIDEGYCADMKTLVVKAQSDAYFRILERNPKMKDVLRMGNYLVFVTPSKIALIIDANNGQEKLTDAEIDGLFVAKK